MPKVAKGSKKVQVNQFQILFTKKKITAFGGFSLLASFFNKIGFKEFCQKIFPVTETSPNSTGVYAKILAFSLTVLAGGKRFAHYLYLGESKEVFAPLFGVTRLPEASSTLTRFFRKIKDWASRKALREAVWNYLAGVIPWKKLVEDDLNLDSHVSTRYGHQTGAKKGMNKKKPGRKSHHPILAFLNISQYVVNLWNRPGNAVSATDVLRFMEETFNRLAGKLSITGVFADSGFYLRELIHWLEKRGLKYVIAAVLHPVLQRKLMSPDLIWVPLLNEKGKPTGFELAEFTFQHADWDDDVFDKPRRYLAIREKVQEGKDILGKALGYKQLRLLPEWEQAKDYRYRVYITNREEDAVTLWRRYRQRADDENRIKELTHDFGLDGFSLKPFFATEAAMLMNVLIYNLFNLFRHEILPAEESVQHASTLRYKYFAIASIAGRQGNQLLLRLGVAGKGMRSKIRWLFDRIQQGFSYIEGQLQCN